MERNSINAFMEENWESLFPNKDYTQTEIEAALLTAPEDFTFVLQDLNLINPTLMIGISIIGGSVALDRFILKEIGTGILKLITMGGLGFWVLADVFTAKKRCRAYNCKKLLEAINDPSKAGKGLNLDVDMDQVVNVAKAAAPGIKAIRKAGKEFSDSLDANKTYYYR